MDLFVYWEDVSLKAYMRGEVLRSAESILSDTCMQCDFVKPRRYGDAVKDPWCSDC